MTILQLKYVIAIAGSSSMREAAGKLYVSQPALSATVQELETELSICIFERTNKGIRLTTDGEEFLAYAKQAVSQYELIEDRYFQKEGARKHFSVSMQHYVFAVQAFIETVKAFPDAQYTYAVHETRTDEVLKNVRDHRSEVGVISYAQSNENLLKKLLKEYGLAFTPLMVRETYAYLWKEHPLAGRKQISLKDLEGYPCISFDQTSDSEFYLPEEALGNVEFEKLIKTNDRATSAELMAQLDGYAIGTGIMQESVVLNNDFVAIKLFEEDLLTIGYIVGHNHVLSRRGTRYIEELLRYREG